MSFVPSTQFPLKVLSRQFPLLSVFLFYAVAENAAEYSLCKLSLPHSNMPSQKPNAETSIIVNEYSMLIQHHGSHSHITQLNFNVKITIFHITQPRFNVNINFPGIGISIIEMR